MFSLMEMNPTSARSKRSRVSNVTGRRPQSGERRVASVAHNVFISGDALHVTQAASGGQWRHVVPHSGTSLGNLLQQPGFHTTWGRFPDDA